MKQKIYLTMLFLGLSSLSFAQSAAIGAAEKSSSFFYRLFHKKNQPHRKIAHFDKQKKDKKLKHNGTAVYNKRKRRKYQVDDSSL